MKLNKRDPEGKRRRLRGVNRQHTGLLIRGVEVRVLPGANSRRVKRKKIRAWSSSGRAPGS